LDHCKKLLPNLVQLTKVVNSIRPINISWRLLKLALL
jgi:hypothetical protein